MLYNFLFISQNERISLKKKNISHYNIKVVITTNFPTLLKQEKDPVSAWRHDIVTYTREKKVLK